MPIGYFITVKFAVQRYNYFCDLRIPLHFVCLHFTLKRLRNDVNLKIILVPFRVYASTLPPATDDFVAVRLHHLLSEPTLQADFGKRRIVIQHNLFQGWQIPYLNQRGIAVNIAEPETEKVVLYLRLCHKSYLVNMTGTSYRIKETKKFLEQK